VHGDRHTILRCQAGLFLFARDPSKCFADIIDGLATSGLRRLDLPTLLRAVGC